MALQIKYTSPAGFIAEEAYVIIKQISINKNIMNVDVLIYFSREARLNNNQPISSNIYQLEHSIDDDAKNAYKQGYEGMKSLPEYSEAIDVLEG